MADNQQHDSSSDFPPGYDPYVDDGKDNPVSTSGPSDTPRPVDVKEDGTNYDTRDGALKYGKCIEAPRIT